MPSEKAWLPALLHLRYASLGEPEATGAPSTPALAFGPRPHPRPLPGPCLFQSSHRPLLLAHTSAQVSLLSSPSVNLGSIISSTQIQPHNPRRRKYRSIFPTLAANKEVDVDVESHGYCPKAQKVNLAPSLPSPWPVGSRDSRPAPSTRSRPQAAELITKSASSSSTKLIIPRRRRRNCAVAFLNHLLPTNYAAQSLAASRPNATCPVSVADDSATSP
ncbi:hypothetical protein B0T26DRAFT_92982 [Lasiosphaeria miniovina]|uniref:Uncharacterized protein n=1 Tax=Lasiosphaeria miniovina TaxID=1954250 RepID=A0AA40EB44_9PEZI|nr:uncharacterized protein B0T26DRAFT_92982 [Lasiosphaeria miniovina]KAK0735034.1 hypothetical protein B0T26DRAFT_92982 [Lasiosphaeria miniovina]